MVTGGLRHGLLLVKGRSSYLFNYIDLLNHDAVYAHDDSDSYGDFIELRIVDGGPPGPQALPPTRFTIPILIMPKDDSPPEVTSNLLLRVRWGQQAKIRRHILDASDLDTSDDYIKLVITEFPKHGQLMIQREWDPVPWPLQERELYQFEIFRGHLLYRHDGSNNLEDSFNFFFRDHFKRQAGIESQVHKIRLFRALFYQHRDSISLLYLFFSKFFGCTLKQGLISSHGADKRLSCAQCHS